MTNKVLERTEIQRTGRKQLSGSTHDIWFYRTLNRVIPSSFCSHHTNFLSASLPSTLKKLPGIVGHQLGKRLHALRGCTTPKPCNHQLPKLAVAFWLPGKPPSLCCVLLLADQTCSFRSCGQPLDPVLQRAVKGTWGC